MRVLCNDRYISAPHGRIAEKAFDLPAVISGGEKITIAIQREFKRSGCARHFHNEFRRGPFEADSGNFGGVEALAKYPSLKAA